MSIKNDIKILLIKNEMSLTDLVNKLNEIFDRNDSVQNLNKKLTKETIRYTEILEIAEALGYEIVWIPKEKREYYFKDPYDFEPFFVNNYSRQQRTPRKQHRPNKEPTE